MLDHCRNPGSHAKALARPSPLGTAASAVFTATPATVLWHASYFAATSAGGDTFIHGTPIDSTRAVGPTLAAKTGWPAGSAASVWAVPTARAAGAAGTARPYAV